MQTADLTLVELDLDRADHEALFRTAHELVQVAANRHLLGDRHASRTADEVLGWLRTDTAHDCRLGIALDAGQPVGQWAITLTRHDNLHLSDVDVVVTPGHRGRGVGGRLLEHVESLARATGRPVVQSWGLLPADPQAPDPTTAFAVRHGYTSTLPSLRSDLDLDRADPASVERALAPLDAEVGGHLDGDDTEYRLLTWWWDLEPGAWLDERAHLTQRMSTDAPTGDMTVEEERWDADRVRGWERTAAAQGRAVVDTAALHVPSGRLVAFTQIAVPGADPVQAFQWNTLVLREHRGHRLGMAIKAANLRAALARFDRLSRVTTYNAASNAPMLRVNRAMGFAPVARETCWEKRFG